MLCVAGLFSWHPVFMSFAVSSDFIPNTFFSAFSGPQQGFLEGTVARVTLDNSSTWLWRSCRCTSRRRPMTFSCLDIFYFCAHKPCVRTVVEGQCHSLMGPPSLVSAVLPLYDRRDPSFFHRSVSLLLQVSKVQSPPPLVLSGSGSDIWSYRAVLYDSQQEPVGAPPPGLLAQPAGRRHPGGHRFPGSLWYLRHVS